MKNIDSSKNQINKINQISRISFPQIITVREIIKKYNLLGIQKKMLNKISQAPSLKEKRVIFKMLPQEQLLDMAADLEQKKISPKDLALIIRQRLNFPKELSENIAEDLKEKIFKKAQKNPTNKINNQISAGEVIFGKNSPIAKNKKRS